MMIDLLKSDKFFSMMVVHQNRGTTKVVNQVHYSKTPTQRSGLSWKPIIIINWTI